MPYVELQNVPTKFEQYRTYLMNNFRRVADSIAKCAGKEDDDDVVITTHLSGFVLTSPNGTRYRINVSDAGVLSTTAL